MIRTSSLAAAWLFAASTLLPMSEAQTAGSPSRSFSEIIGSYREKEQGFREARKANPKAERPNPYDVVPELVASLKQHPESKEVPAATAWILRFAPDNDAMAAAATALHDHHVTHPEIKSLLRLLGREGGVDFVPFLKKVEQTTSLDGELRVQSLLTAGEILLTSLEKAQHAEGAAVLDDLVKRYGQDPSAADFLATAKQMLFKYRSLSVGNEAPDVTGKDYEGKSFKLSDYRGKVVVLAFWGFW